MKRPDKTILRQWIDDVNTLGRGLSKWEENFMISITDQFDRSGRLSERQIAILEQIYAEKTP